MDAKYHCLTRAPLFALALTALAACSDPFPFTPEAKPTPEAPPPVEEICESSANWLPVTPPMEDFNPPPHPESECPFYRGGWHNFLIATQPDPVTGAPAFKSYPTIDTMFRFTKPLQPNRSWLGDIKQAGGRQILIDQNGRTLYYGIHANEAFASFVKQYGLETPDAIKNADDSLFFPAGVIIFKSAWQEVEADDPSLDNWIHTTAMVPTLSQANDGPSNTPKIHEDRNNPREITARLLALHVVFTLPGHPEFVWATFEHSDGVPDNRATDLHRDVAPIHPGEGNPTADDPFNSKDETVISDQSHILYKANTTAQTGNKPLDERDLVLDPASQTFKLRADGSTAQTSIYRMFPASKSNTVDPDDAITSLNHNVEELFNDAAAARTLASVDKRGHYRLVGAQWMDKPAFFRLNSSIQNKAGESPLFMDPENEGRGINQEDERIAALAANLTPEATATQDVVDNGSDSAFSLTAGEDRLSSTAMESFTQGPSTFPNCFNCHNTQAIQAKGVPFVRDESSPILLQPKLLNVTHIFAQFLLDDTENNLLPTP